MYYAEHRFLGDTIRINDNEIETVTATLPSALILQLENGLLVTCGEINGFAGDYFGLEKFISAEANFDKRKDAFQRWFDLLGFSHGGKLKAEAFRAKLKPLNDAADKVMREPSGGTADDLAAVYKKSPLDIWQLDKLSVDMRWANGAGFMQLLEKNVDHFGEEARVTYNAGHALALDWASKGQLNKALSINAFADHFLEDSFAAGHLRVPRAQIMNVGTKESSAIPQYSKIVNASSNVMHEEDGEIGLWVQSPSGQKWKAYGDGRLPGKDVSDKATTTNLDQCRRALETSAQEVRNAYTNKQVIAPANFAAWQHAPILDLISKDPDNHDPLLKVENGAIYRRVNGLKSNQYERTSGLTWVTFYTENFSRVESQVRLMVEKWLGVKLG